MLPQARMVPSLRQRGLPSEVFPNFRKFLLGLSFSFDALEIEWFVFQQLNRSSAF